MSHVNRIFIPDALKAIAILLVVIGHFSETRDPLIYYVLKQHFIYLFHMSLFFIAGGYLIGINKYLNTFSHLWSWWLHKAKAILPYYLFLFILSLIAIAYYSDIHSISDSMLTVIFMPMYSHVSILWFLQSYLTILVVGWLMLRYLSVFQVILFFLFSLPLSIWAFSYGQTHAWIRFLSLNLSLINLPFFILGYLLSFQSAVKEKSLLEQIATNTKLFVLALAVVLLLVCRIFLNPPEEATHYSLYKLAVTFSILPVLSRIGAWFETSTIAHCFIEYCSRESILIYVTHSAILFIWHNIAIICGIDMRYFWLQVFGSLFFCVAFPLFYKQILQHWKASMRFLANKL